MFFIELSIIITALLLRDTAILPMEQEFRYVVGRLELRRHVLGKDFERLPDMLVAVGAALLNEHNLAGCRPSHNARCARNWSGVAISPTAEK